MVRIAQVVGVLAVVVGVIWFGQGMGWIHGSFMTGRTLYVALGLVVGLVGLVLVTGPLLIARRRARSLP